MHRPKIEMLLRCATLAAADDVGEMPLWGRQNLPFLRRIPPYRHGIPSQDTLGEVLRVINPELFKARVTC